MQILEKLKNNPDYKRLFENFISLSVLQALNYILPLVTFPYLVRVLGVEKFGLLSFASATIAYFQILTDYGFNLSATREVAIYRDNKEKLQEIFSSVMIIKFGLLLVSLILLSIVVFSFNKFRQDWLVYYLSFGVVLGQVLFPVWFFQGMERMRYITILNVVAKGIFTIAIFAFVKSQSDYWKVPLINSIGFVIAGIASFVLIYKYFNVVVTKVSKITIFKQLQDGWHIFISNIAVNLYTVSTTFILGLLTNNIIVGYYSAANKLIQAVKGLMGPVSQTLYPYINKKVVESKEIALILIRKITKVVAMIAFFISLAVFLFAKEIIDIVLGPSYNESILVLKILSCHPFLIGLSNVFGIQTMLPFNKKVAFQNILISASILNLVLAFILVPMFKHIGSAISVTIVELFVTVTMFIYLQKNDLKIVRI